MSTGALYPGTFDPFTNGHEEIARRAAKLFGRVVIAVATSSAKAPLFTLDERINLIRAVLEDLADVDVVGYDDLTVQAARQNDVGVIVRGLRAANDFEYELQLASMNRHLEPAVESVFLTPSEQHMFVSSTLVREIAAMGGDVSGFVHPLVNAALGKQFP
jgi:pantetheine-phosphate adenylyltransferase